MPGTSAYIQISRYALLEYQYNSEYIPVKNTTGSAGALRLENKYLGTYQFLNTSPSVNLTGNVLDRSAAKMGPVSNRWAYFDIDTAVPIYEIDSNFTLVNETTNLITLAGRYDTARIHILSGFDFPGIDGMILQIQWKEWSADGTTNNRIFDACDHVYLKGQEQINFNPNPLFLGDRLYDRYIDVKVPSLYDVNQDFWNSPLATNTIGYNYTFDNVGFLQNSQILANLYEIDSTETLNGNRYFMTGNVYKTSFNAADNYSQLGVVIQENSEYDYIEYYPTWNGAFIETYLNDLNSAGGDWTVINQIEVYEQVGTGQLRTSNMTMLQENNYDQPGIFRPVIQNSSIAFSYTVDYTMRFFNRVDNTEIIRRSAYTSTDVKKYGKQLDKVNVLQGYTPVKVYNKIVQMSSEDTANMSDATTQKEVITQQVVVPVYYDTNMISVDSTTDIAQSLGETVWPQGTNTVYLGAFDNIVKFKIYTKSSDKKQNVSFNLSTYINTIALSFNTTDSNKLYVPAYIDINLANPAMGEVSFKIDSTTAVKILASSDKEYYIVNRTNPETVLYSGKFDSVNNKAAGTAKSVKSVLDSLDSQIKSKQAELAKMNTEATTNTQTVGATQTGGGSASPSTDVLNAKQSANLKITKANQKQLSQAQAAQQTAIQQAAQTGEKINIVEVPGVSSNLGANPLNNIKPLVQNPAAPSTGFNPANNPTTQGNTAQN